MSEVQHPYAIPYNKATGQYQGPLSCGCYPMAAMVIAKAAPQSGLTWAAIKCLHGRTLFWIEPVARKVIQQAAIA